MKLLPAAIFCSFLLLPLACQDDPTVDTSGVDPVAKDILEGLAQNQAVRVYDAYFTPEYRDELPLETWLEMATAYRLRLGPVLSVSRLRGSAAKVGDAFVDGQVIYVVTWKNGMGRLTLNVTLMNGWKVRYLQLDSPVFEQALSAPATEGLTETIDLAE